MEREHGRHGSIVAKYSCLWVLLGSWSIAGGKRPIIAYVWGLNQFVNCVLPDLVKEKDQCCKTVSAHCVVRAVPESINCSSRWLGEENV